MSASVYGSERSVILVRFRDCNGKCIEVHGSGAASHLEIEVSGVPYGFGLGGFMIRFCHGCALSLKDGCALNHLPDFGLRVSASGFRVSGSKFRVPGFGFMVPDFGFRVSGT